MDGVRLTTLGPRDVNALLAASGLFDRPVRPEWAQRFLSTDGHHLLLAQDELGRPVGFITGIEMTHPDKGTEMFVYELSVKESAQHQGVGSRLLEALREIAVEQGCYGMRVATGHDNKAARRTYVSGGATEEENQVVAVWDWREGAVG